MRHLLVAGLLLSSTVAAAQESIGPPAGAWGVEGSSNYGSLLKFRSPSKAWLFNVAASYSHLEREQGTSTGTVSSTENNGSIYVQLGHRWYRNVDRRTRPFTTLALSAGTGGLSSDSRSYGALLELGAAHFFGPHVSLGMSGELRATYSRHEGGEPPFKFLDESIGVSMFGFRFLGAVYF